MAKNVVGLDEAGRGPLAGPVVAAAVVLDPGNSIEGIQDSKVMTASKREQLFDNIRCRSIAYGIAMADVEEIDDLNILQATLLAMRRAFNQLEVDVATAWVDGTIDPELKCETHLLVKGDSRREDIGAASILAKVTRDKIMCQYAEMYPEYGFEQHKGYPTRSHLASLRNFGPTPIHRRSFKPVQNVVNNGLFE